MKKEDLKEIAELVTTVVDDRLGQFQEEITEEFRHQLGLQREDFQTRVDIVVEGHQLLDGKIERQGEQLNEKIDRQGEELSAKIDRQSEVLGGKIDRLDERLGRVEEKVDGVAEDLAEHRRDTEAHKGGYKAMDE